MTVTAPDCTPRLTALPAPGATIDLILLAPCIPDAAVVVRHAGLAVSARTSASGSLFLTLPAMEGAGAVEVRLPDGAAAEAAVPVDLAGLRRIALQWQAPDAFQLHAFEGGADYGTPGHVWEGRVEAAAGAFVRLGDADVPQALLAEVYTFPPAGGPPVRVTAEAEVTAQTCGRDMLGEGLSVGPMGLERVEITLAMPACDAVGDFLVLNIPEPRPTLAAAAAAD